MTEIYSGIKNVALKHECIEFIKLSSINQFERTWGIHGNAITQIVMNYVGWWAEHQHEYASRIYFCPFCGTKLQSWVI